MDVSDHGAARMRGPDAGDVLPVVLVVERRPQVDDIAMRLALASSSM
jgi:hypothetical protein